MVNLPTAGMNLIPKLLTMLLPVEVKYICDLVNG